MERLLGFDAQLLFDSAVTAVNVLIVFGVLSYFLFNPVRGFLEKRREKIAGDLDKAAELKAEAEKMKAEYESRLKLAGQDAQAVADRALEEAGRQRSAILEEARQEASRMTDRARAEIGMITRQAAEEMKREQVSVAALMAMKAVAGFLDDEAQKALFDKTLKEMGEVAWQSRR